ncbi:MAG: DUF433 domain-containing protein [Terriglobales bacterium]
MLRNKPVRQRGQDIRTLPTYTIPEAAAFLAIPRRTLASWYEGDEPILKASGRYSASASSGKVLQRQIRNVLLATELGTVHLLSYRDIEEAYRVFLLRERFDFSFQFLRTSMRNARKMFRSSHPLQRADAVKECLHDLIYDKPARAGKPRTVTSLGRKPGQQLVEEVANMFSERIEAGHFIFPWRFAATDHTSRPVSMNPNIMSGRLVVAGTRIPVTTLLGQKRTGRNVDEIASDYGLEPQTVQQALTHIGIRQKAA